MTGQKTWLEAALNGPWPREQQPAIPVTVDEVIAEGIACAEAGAAIIHIHARHPETGLQLDCADIYAEIINGIRSQVDAIVYPTIPLRGAPGHEVGDRVETRFAAVRDLAERGLLEWCVVDPGSVNFLHENDLSTGGNGFVYSNPIEHVRAGLDMCRDHRVHPSYAVYEAGFIRVGSALWDELAPLPAPIYRFMFSDSFKFGFPPRDYALRALKALLDECAPGAHWMLSGLSVDIEGLIPVALDLGGHIRVGLEDAPLGSARSNLELVTRACELIEGHGHVLATPDEVRRAAGPGWPG